MDRIKLKSQNGDYSQLDDHEKFMYQMVEHFGFEEEKIELMLKLQDRLKEVFPDTTQNELDWYFTRLLGGFSYGDGITSRFLWNSTAGNPYTLSTKYIASEEDFSIHFLEFTEEEDELLRYKVRIQNFITSNPDITDWERLKREVGKREQY
ncbi:MAG TPA: hypothetical protein VK119_13170, partial [Bacillota bacterium]|nr:hypothetical protein [Bacillota bacterium]